MQVKMRVLSSLVAAGTKALRAGAHTLQLSGSQGRTFAFFLRTKKVSPKCVLLHGFNRGA